MSSQCPSINLGKTVGERQCQIARRTSRLRKPMVAKTQLPENLEWIPQAHRNGFPRRFPKGTTNCRQQGKVFPKILEHIGFCFFKWLIPGQLGRIKLFRPKPSQMPRRSISEEASPKNHQNLSIQTHRPKNEAGHRAKREWKKPVDRSENLFWHRIPKQIVV